METTMNASAPCLSQEELDRYWKQGYLMMKGVFAPDEIMALRNQVIVAEEKRKKTGVHVGDILATPEVSEIVYDSRILERARSILESTPVYFGDSNYSIISEDYREYDHVGGFHRDNTDRTRWDAPDWQSRYDVLRFGIYLQDHSDRSGGLLVRAKSHLKPGRSGISELLSERYLNSALGDLVVWNLRILHAGVGRFVRGYPWLPISQRAQKIVPRFLHAPRPDLNRAAIFLTYGARGPHLDRYLKYLTTRTWSIACWDNSPWSPELISKCQEHGLDLVDMNAELPKLRAAGVTIGQFKKYKAYPY
jgi:hypothetical protein